MVEKQITPSSDSDRVNDNVINLPGPPDESGNSASQFIRDHPGVAIAGGVAAGLLIGAFLPRKAGRKLAKRAYGLAEIAGTAGLVLGRQALEMAETTGSGLRSRGERVAGKAEELGEATAARIERLGGSARERVKGIVAPAEKAAAKAGQTVTQKASQIRARIAR